MPCKSSKLFSLKYLKFCEKLNLKHVFCSVAIFLAASAIVTSTTIQADLSKAGEKKDLGGFKEWTTDQAIDEESTLDDAAKKAAKKAKKRNVCIPIGEGENCW